jgi:hypothetical protein
MLLSHSWKYALPIPHCISQACQCLSVKQKKKEEIRLKNMRHSFIISTQNSKLHEHTSFPASLLLGCMWHNSSFRAGKQAFTETRLSKTEREQESHSTWLLWHIKKIPYLPSKICTSLICHRFQTFHRFYSICVTWLRYSHCYRGSKFFNFSS